MDTPNFMPADIGVLFHSKVKFFFPEIIGTAVSTGGAITAWQVQAQWAIACLAGLAGLVSGILTIRSVLKKEHSLKTSKLADTQS